MKINTKKFGGLKYYVYICPNQLKIYTMSNVNELIQNELRQNPKTDRKALAEKYNVNIFKVSANFTTLIRKGEITNEKEIKLPIEKKLKKVVDTIDKLTSSYEQAKKKGNTYTNHGGENKDKARNVMVKHIVDSAVEGIVPTLPNTEWEIEKRINTQLSGIEFLGVERERDTFNKMRTNLRKIKDELKANTYFGNIGDVLYGKLENTYAHLILDYCGNLATISKEIEYSINNDIVKIGGIMAITFAKPIRGIDKQSDKLRQLGAINNTDERCQSDKSVEAYFYKISGWNYQVLEFFYYQDTYPMTLVILKRMK